MPQPLTPVDLGRFRFVDHPRVSRDGRRVAYQVWWPDVEARANQSRVWVRDLAEADGRQVTEGPYDFEPEWSPRGDRLLFLRRNDGLARLLTVSAAGDAEPEPLAELPDGITSARWSPDGSRVAFLGRVLADPDGVVDDPRPGEGSASRRPPVARIVRRLDQWADGRGHLDGRYDHLFVVDAAGGEPRPLTSGPWSVHDFAWSPDGAAIAYLATQGPDADLGRDVDVHVVDLEGRSREVVGGVIAHGIAWSPRGDTIAFTAPAGDGGGLLERVWTVPAGGGEARCLTAGFDLSAGDGIITDTRPGHDMPMTWSSGGSRIYFLASGPGWTGIHSVDVGGAVREEVVGPRRIFNFDVVGGTAVYCAGDVEGPGDLYLHDGRQERRLTDLNPWLRDRYVARPERLQFTASDGLEIEGWLLRPEGFDPADRYPLVLQVHGGPHGQYGLAFFHEFQVLAGMGFMVLYLNPRGSDGYGEEFRKKVVRDWGGADFHDLMAGLDHVLAMGFADEARLGIAGGSYGGYMTNWAITQTDRFRAAVSMRSISNLVSDYASNDIVPWSVLEMGPEPWPNPEELWSRSPIRYVRNVRTPLLLTHGEMDIRCPIHQAEELFGALRLLGREVELARFPEESHDFSRGGRPDRRVERLERIADWFRRHLVEAPEAVAAAAPEGGAAP